MQNFRGAARPRRPLARRGRVAHRPRAATRALPAAGRQPRRITYQHDPDHPVPTAGGSIAHLAEIDTPDDGWDKVPPFGERAAVYGGQGSQIVPWGPMDQREHDWFAGDHAAGGKLSQRPESAPSPRTPK